jgi:hypothetical protein
MATTTSAHALTKTHFCHAPDCEEEVRSPVGPYSYCQRHRDERGIPTGAGGTKPGSFKKMLSNGETHEGRLRVVLAAARALDRAEEKERRASAELSKARKAHRDALIAATAPHGVTHED